MTKQIKVIFDLTFSIGDFGLSSNFFKVISMKAFFTANSVLSLQVNGLPFSKLDFLETNVFN